MKKVTERPQPAIHLKAKDLAYISIFAALYAVLGFIPLFYIFGAYGQYITAALIIAPIIGIILGPVGGTLATAIGGVIGMMLTASTPMGSFSFLPETFNTLCAGLIFRGKWYVSAGISAAFIAAFAALPSRAKHKPSRVDNGCQHTRVYRRVS